MSSGRDHPYVHPDQGMPPAMRRIGAPCARCGENHTLPPKETAHLSPEDIQSLAEKVQGIESPLTTGDAGDDPPELMRFKG